jgi:hypothetical protein
MDFGDVCRDKRKGFLYLPKVGWNVLTMDRLNRRKDAQIY